MEDRDQLLQSTNQALNTLTDRLEALARQRAQRQSVIPDKVVQLSSNNNNVTNDHQRLSVSESLTSVIQDNKEGDNVDVSALSGRTNTYGSTDTIGDDDKLTHGSKEKSVKGIDTNKMKGTRINTKSTNGGTNSNSSSATNTSPKNTTVNDGRNTPKPTVQSTASHKHSSSQTNNSSNNHTIEPHNNTLSASPNPQNFSIAELINAVAEADAKLEDLERKRASIALERAIFRASESARLRERQVREEQIRMARLQLAMRGKNHKRNNDDQENNDKSDDDNNNTGDNMTVQSMYSSLPHHNSSNRSTIQQNPPILSSRSVMTSLGRSSVSFANKPPTGKLYSSSSSSSSSVVSQSVKSYVRYSDLPPPDRSRPPLRKNSINFLSNTNDTSLSTTVNSNGPPVLNLSRLITSKVGNINNNNIPSSNQESSVDTTAAITTNPTTIVSVIPTLAVSSESSVNNYKDLPSTSLLPVDNKQNTVKRNTMIPAAYLKEGPYQEAFMAYEKILSANTTDILYNSNLPSTENEHPANITDPGIISKDDEEKLIALLKDIPSTESGLNELPKQSLPINDPTVVYSVKFRQ